MPLTPARGSRLRIVLIVAGILGTTLAHYYTPASLILWHNIFQRLYYLPIVYAAVYFGWVGGLLAALIAGICYTPHILMAWHDFPGYIINQYAEIVLFFLVGVTTGLLADEQRKKQAELEDTAQKLGKANQELRDSFERLKRADRLAAIGNLSAGLAHEIRNPLASIEGAAGILEQGRVTEEQRLEFLGIIRKECRRLNRLLSNLLDFARPPAPRRQTIAVEPLLESVIDLIAPATANKQIRLRKAISPPGVTLDGDGEQLKQVILNLLLNAVQAMPDGGEIRLAAHPENSDLLIEVIDEGCGIAPESLDKIFTPFFTTKEEGTGLGLAVAYQIVSQHGGILRARNNPERGMTFSILLPREQVGA
ncbi:MAG: ATP-binding protein [Acidobacteriota bacterium]|jgi:signal transduction histidine kinase